MYFRFDRSTEEKFVNKLNYYSRNVELDGFTELRDAIFDGMILSDSGNFYPSDLVRIFYRALEENVEIRGGLYNSLPDQLFLRTLKPCIAAGKELPNPPDDASQLRLNGSLG